ncbi:hypothetical protein [Evansella tamaricis]|uniref:Uncharacterized protein n=1 Tax=Evansella tamaricis TaxID=2069301 RepID=A0ABS6JGA8_9BACI|nr:hypothetical protein [Evansella tamaricis]MBU9712727.1 hypothetical protein [Evansella tamaricis]
MWNTRFRLPILLTIILIGIGAIYYYYYSGPDEFLSEGALLDEIRDYYYEADSSTEIQDIIFIDESHVFVPFRINNIYGTSYWYWEKRKWNLRRIDTIQTPTIWRVDPEDPSTFVFLWNMSPDTDLHEGEFFMINPRNYFVSNNVHTYTPHVQLSMTIPFTGTSNSEKSFGVVSIPEDWKVFLQEYYEVEHAKIPNDSFFDSFFPHSSVYFGWKPFDKEGNIYYPQIPNGSGYGFGDSSVDYLRNINEYDIE